MGNKRERRSVRTSYKMTQKRKSRLGNAKKAELARQMCDVSEVPTMILSKPSERLYLQKGGDQDIYVNLYKSLPQHQLDGIRYLFRQFKKKTPGVILNDPSGYGKCLQAVLFLNALRPVLKKPVLILSDSIANWKEHFEQWTDCNEEEMAVETSNPYTKKLIHFSPIREGLSYGRRSWSIVVLHDQDCTKELLGMSFYADYKIWVTSKDLKENLCTLASIYEWLYPNHKFHVEDFTAKKENWRDVLQKAILLKAFSEDFLIRRTDFWPPFKRSEHHKSTPSPVKSTKKNKDPTGTKVKRSKRKKIEENSMEQNVTTDESTVPNKIANKTKSNDTRTSKDKYMDVEKFIRNENPIASDSFKDFLQDSNESSQSICITVNVPNVEGLDYAIKEIVRNEKEAQNRTNGDEIMQLACGDVSQNRNDKEMLHFAEINNSKASAILVQATEDSNDYHSKDRPGIIIPETENSEDSASIFDEILAQKSSNWDVNDVINTGQNGDTYKSIGKNNK